MHLKRQVTLDLCSTAFNYIFVMIYALLYDNQSDFQKYAILYCLEMS